MMFSSKSSAPASAALTCTFTSGTPGPKRPSPFRSSSGTSSSAPSSRSAPTLRTSTSAKSSPARGMSSAAGAEIVWRAAATSARTPTASASIGPALRRVYRVAAHQCVGPRVGRVRGPWSVVRGSTRFSHGPRTTDHGHRPRHSSDLRPLWQRRPHCVIVRHPRRGRAYHRRRAYRLHGGGHR